jgi:hypothetical protein
MNAPSLDDQTYSVRFIEKQRTRSEQKVSFPSLEPYQKSKLIRFINLQIKKRRQRKLIRSSENFLFGESLKMERAKLR